MLFEYDADHMPDEVAELVGAADLLIDRAKRVYDLLASNPVDMLAVGHEINTLIFEAQCLEVDDLLYPTKAREAA